MGNVTSKKEKRLQKGLFRHEQRALLFILLCSFSLLFRSDFISTS